MCYHNSMTKKVKDLAARYGRKTDLIEGVEEIIEEQYHVSAFGCPLYPIITDDQEIQVYNWGLIPFWAKTMHHAEEIRKKTFNARAESIFEKPSFRSSITSKRCLIPSTGFFDWRHEKGKKIPYFIYVKDQEIFSMAGIYDSWKNPETGRTVTTFSIITTEANPLMHHIHNTNFRMPALLHREDEEKWLYPELTQNDIESLLEPFDDQEMEAYVIQNNFLKKSSRDPTILAPQKGKSASTQGDLWAENGH